MQVIYAINPDTNNAARVVMRGEGYSDLFIDFLIGNGLHVAITDEAEKPHRTSEEESAVRLLMMSFREFLKSRVLH